MQPQSSPPHTRLQLDDPGELIAAIPVLLTFHPTDSVLLLTYTGLRRRGLESVLRMDIPAPELIADVAEQLRVVALNHDAAFVDLVVLGGPGADPPDRLPARELVDRVTGELEREDIEVSHAVWAPRIEHRQTWWCYADPDCTGRVRDPQACTVTAELTAAGAVTFGSRAELAALLAPDPDEALARRAALIAVQQAGSTEQEYRFVKDTLDTIVGRVHTDPHNPVPALDDPTIARLAGALSTPDIREACLAFTMTIRAPAAELLWTVLTRAIPGPARADPASLLGVASYLHGDGARAALALDAALTADPDHRLAQTLRHVLDNGVPPDRFRALLANSFVAAFANR
jgi:uncharacterized protein DUF4192